jgi:two-component system, chemotaxis family, chemotaxis protein CheY
MFPSLSRRGTGNVRILIAEADGSSRARYRDACVGAGWDVIEAEDGRDALVKALVHHPTVTVSAVDLPLIDGLTLCDIIRRDRLVAQMPILLVTADTHPLQLDRAREAGADLVIKTTIDAEELIGHVRQLIARHGAAAEPLRPSRSPEDQVFSKRRRPFATTTPPSPPPTIACPFCGVKLTYEESHIGGVIRGNPERWDYFTCGRCGRFQYRHRTRKLRQV